MILTKISVQSFRNLDATTLEFCKGFNILYGDNAQGKTNLLESIFLLGTLKSFRHARNSDLIAWDTPFSLIRGAVTDDLTRHELALLLEKGSKKVRIDQKTVTRVAEFFGILTVVLFAPEELLMVRGAPDSRRRYLDRAIFAGDLHYLTQHHEYSRILKQRNSLLRSGDSSALEPWNEQLAMAGGRLAAQRVDYLTRIGDLLSSLYREITGTMDRATIAYRSSQVSYSADETDNSARILAALAGVKNQERLQQTTLLGPHRDDLAFTLNGKPLRHAASQGQQRCYVLALKMAEIEYLRKLNGHPPVLLLDDMTSELDRQRTANLVRFLTQRGMQVFITTTSLDQVGLFAEHETLRTFHVKQGSVQRQELQ
ncbi:MAG: DNA replication/repair protein RecF [Geobacter sp.]|nr:DNA replication/repair protein RecF [Geobacter sp.]